MAILGEETRFDDPRWRGYAYQALLVVVVATLVGVFAYNAYVNMEARGIPMGFGFWNDVAGFQINLHLIPYSELSTYGRAFWVGLLNTLLVGAISIPLATVIGFAIGAARLSPNWLLSRFALIYTNVLRNTPLLLQLLFWYNAVLRALPGPRQSLNFRDTIFLNNRGLFFPLPVAQPSFGGFAVVLVLALVLAAAFGVWVKRRQERTGAQSPVGTFAVAAIVGLPALAVLIGGAPFSFELSKLSGFNLKGGIQVIPEMGALIFGLVTFTGAFIAEIVRSGIQSVPRGQFEAANSLGLHRGLATRLIVLPQAIRLIIPPLTSQYLNIIKNSSLAVFVGYPDLVHIFAGTVLNQTHAAVQVMAITMAVYLVISLVVATTLNTYNASHAWRER
jgi:general L-amino acid transport system permease protein